VDSDDLGAIIAGWLMLDCGSCGGRDLNGDGNVNLADVARFTDARWAGV
jgi:hypothetical protein